MTAVGELVAVGRTSDVYEFGRGAVVKVPRPDVPAHWASMEAQYTSAVRSVGAPAPQVIDTVRVEGRDGIVFERVYGPSMWQRMLEEPEQAAVLAQELARVHHQILSAGLPSDVLGLVDHMGRKISEVAHLSDRDRRHATLLLENLPRGAALLHGDLHPGNVLMSPDGPVVIDWFDAAIGHPVADVVRSSLLLRPFGDAPTRGHLSGGSVGLLAEIHQQYVAAMRDVLCVGAEIVGGWESVVAVSRLAEGIVTDEPDLIALWDGRGTSPLVSLLSDLD